MRSAPTRYFIPSQQELKAQEDAAGWEQAQGIASGLGTGLGAAAGGLLTFVNPALGGIGAAAGGALGGIAGSAIGGALDENFGGLARKRAALMAQARQKQIDKFSARQEALQRLLSGNYYG